MALASGLAFAQGERASSFTKYLASTPVKYIDFLLLQAKVSILEMHMTIDGEAILPIPSLSYDAENDRIEAFVTVTGDFIKLPLDQIKNRLRLERALCNGALARWMPGLQKRDFALIIHVVGKDGEKPFAECDQLECTIR
jgi:hypothetical protein